ncbi:NAD(P)/FAD-dependent oxidoreductase [Leptothermofonsia sp. ETS-13]|uniref:NAD(P)/FAD-dependent oxidoreductase n=1 Tax=Leptothermofonsia sp. ETS-13 TaxID=3035696 RepID=UPI003B9DD92C
MARVVIVGCGVIGAAIAYELSQVPELAITVLDHQLPAQGATGAALGVLMGAISQKRKGYNLQRRLTSIQRYNDWIPELEAVTGRRILFNRQGILRLCLENDDLNFWKTLAELRQQQGWLLEICDRAWVSSHCPHLNLERAIGAVYSPQDRQVDPTALTLALVQAAEQNGAQLKFDQTVTGADTALSSTGLQNCQQIYTQNNSFSTDWLVIAAGLGSTPLTAALGHAVDIRPVLGQAVHVQLKESLGNPTFQPIITAEDTHFVPLGNGHYWVGATVEFPAFPSEPIPDGAALEALMQRAIAFCPALLEATIIRTWSGLRPRPEGQPAPLVEKLSGFQNVLLATGHYRNGMLLAPATAEQIRQMVVGEGEGDKLG